MPSLALQTAEHPTLLSWSRPTLQLSQAQHSSLGTNTRGRIHHFITTRLHVRAASQALMQSGLIEVGGTEASSVTQVFFVTSSLSITCILLQLLYTARARSGTSLYVRDSLDCRCWSLNFEEKKETPAPFFEYQMDTTEIQEVEHYPLLGSSSLQQSKEILERSEYWTSIDNTLHFEQGDARVFPGKKVPKYMNNQIQFHEQIGEGGQGVIYNAKLLWHPKSEEMSSGNYAVKRFKGKLHENYFGQWPEELFEIHSMCNYVCHFYGYSNDGDSFCLLMYKYDCSLRHHIDKQMKKRIYKGRPFHGPIALSIIIQIAIGMAYLHQLNIIHRDLKADNILVMYIGEHDDTPAGVYIGDFDVAPTVLGTGFWRAPEILQALKDNKHLYNTGGADTSVYIASKRALPFTTKSDVYSFGMVCYEILTGGIPFEGTKFSNYDVVLSGGKPKLPANINPKMVDLLNKCWHHDPDARPTFKEIVVELKGFVEGTDALMAHFNQADLYLKLGPVDPELSFVELKQLVHVLVEKYNEEDFVKFASELIVEIEEFVVQFSMQSYKEHPSLPFYEGFNRMVLSHSINLKNILFMDACPTVFPEFQRIWALLILIMNTINYGRLDGSLSHSENTDLEENLTEEEMTERIAMFTAFNELCAEYRQRPRYVNRHGACHKLLTNKNHKRDHDDIQPCSFCKDLPFYAPKSSNSQICTFELYKDNFVTLKRVFSMIY